jgi:hypothetical protein
MKTRETNESISKIHLFDQSTGDPVGPTPPLLLLLVLPTRTYLFLRRKLAISSANATRAHMPFFLAMASIAAAAASRHPRTRESVAAAAVLL